MLDATVYPARDGFHVSLTLFGEEVDDAGPFDDLADALQMAQRAADNVAIADAIGCGDPTADQLNPSRRIWWGISGGAR